MRQSFPTSSSARTPLCAVSVPPASHTDFLYRPLTPLSLDSVQLTLGAKKTPSGPTGRRTPLSIP
jgi:hypothetical protein